MKFILNMLLVLLSLLTFATPSASFIESTIEIQSHDYCTSSRHVHLSSLADASTSVTISFSSQPCDPPEGEYSEHHEPMPTPLPLGAVLIGDDPNSLQVVMGDIPLRYNATIYHHKAKNNFDYTSEYQHHVTVDNLEPHTTYYYRCIVIKTERVNSINDDNDDVEVKEESRNLRHLLTKQDSSEIFSFRTAPAPKSGKSTKIAILGDLGDFYHTRETLNILSSRLDELDSIVLVGDLSYANGDHHKWDSWFDMLDETHIFHQKQMYIVSGNHDVEGDLLTGTMYQAFENRFRMPRIQKPVIGRVTIPQDVDLNKMYRLHYDYGNSFYSYTNGMLHNIVLNSFADFETGSNQYRWLLVHLASIDRQETPWVMVSIHCPFYNTFSTHQNDPQPVQMKKHLEPLLVKYRVNFVVSGHVHAYSRSKPVANNLLTPTGPIHIVLGNGGRQANAPFHNQVPEEWVTLRDHTTYGYGTIQVLNKTSALYEWVQAGRNEETDGVGRNFLNPPKNMTDFGYVENQYFL